MGARQSKLDRRRWRLADLFKRARPLRQHADPPCLRTPTPIREANRDAGLEKVAQRPQSRMAWATRRRLAAAVINAALLQARCLAEVCAPVTRSNCSERSRLGGV